MRHHFYLYLLVLLGCTKTASSLQQKEKGLVGNWMESVNNGEMQGWYMEFHQDRTGVFGPAINVKGKVGLFMPFVMKDWKIENDTLSIQFKLQSDYAAYGPDGKKMEKSDKPSYARYIVREVSDTVIVLEDLTAEFPGMKDRLIKSERLEPLSN